MFHYCRLFVILFVVAHVKGISTQQPLRLLSMLPYPIPNKTVQPAFSEGDALFLASQLAVDLINNRTDLLSGYNLELIQINCGCDLLNVLELSFFDNIVYSDVNIQGVVGPGCSESALFLGNQIAQPALEILSISLAGSNKLKFRDDFHNSFSVIGSSTLYVQAIRAIIRNQQWKNVSVLHDLSRSFFSSIQQQLESDVTETQYSFMSLFPGNLRYTPDRSLPLRCVPVSRVTIILASAGVISELICLFTKNEAFHDKVYPSYQFLIVNRTPQSILQNTSFLYGDKNISCSAEEISDRLNGTVFLEYRFTPLDRNAMTTTGMSYKQFKTLYDKKIKKYQQINNVHTIQSVWAPAYFDATWALAVALNNSRVELFEREGLELSDYRPGLSNATAIVRNQLKKLHLNGVSGTFKLENDGFVKRYIDIRQFIDGSFRKFEFYDNVLDDISYFGQGVAKVDYIGWQFNKVVVNDFVTGGMLIAFIVLITSVIVFLHIVSILNKKHPSIKATNPKLYHFAYAGIYLESIGTVIYIIGSTFGIPQNQHCYLLHFTVLFNSSGVVLVFSSLAAISFRIYRIFVHYMHPGPLIGDCILIGFVVISTSVYFVCYLILALVYTPNTVVSCVSTHKDVLVERVNCRYDISQWMIITHIFPILISLLAFTFAALSIGKVKMEIFRTSSILLVCFLSLCNVCVWIVYYQIQVIGQSTNPDIRSCGGDHKRSVTLSIYCFYFSHHLYLLLETIIKNI